MARKKVRRNASRASKRFRLLCLKHEMQADTKVLKTVVDEVDVLRLCHSLGMATSDEGNTSRMHKFEFGLFNPSDYDADFAHFIGEKIFTGPGYNQEGEDQLKIGCLFGKQDQVETELSRMGLLNSDYGSDLRPQDQGIYCIERGNEGNDCRQFVVFTWLGSGLFGPECIRDIPTLMLCFLLSLSSSITCCLSLEDLQCIRREVDAASDSTNRQRNSFSVAFRVQKQVEKCDSITCGASSSTSIPHADQIKSLDFIAGVFPAVAIECRTSPTTEWHERTDIVPSDTFEEWVSEKHGSYAIQLPRGWCCPTRIRDRVLVKFDCFPDVELRESEKAFHKMLDEAGMQIDADVSHANQQTFNNVVQDADMLFAVRSPTNSSRMDEAWMRYEELLQQFGEYGILRQLDDHARRILYMPERFQSNMIALNNVFMRHRSAFDEILDAVVNDSPIDVIGGGSILQTMEDAVWVAINWLWSRKEQFHRDFHNAMDQRRARLQRVWVNMIKDVIPTFCVALHEEKNEQCKDKLMAQLCQRQEAIKNDAFYTLRTHLESCGDHRLGAKFNSLKLTSDATAIKVDWAEEMEKEPSKVIHVYQLSSANNPVEAPLLGIMEFEPGFELLKLATVKTCKLVAILVGDGQTTVYRIQFTPQVLSSKQPKVAEQIVVRTFPHLSSLCSVRAHDRRVAFAFERTTERLGSIAICRFNEAFTSIEPTHIIDMDTVFRLTPSLVDILLTERSLCAVDANGDMQSYDTRSRQTSKKLSLGDPKSKDRRVWVSGLLCFADELVVSRANIEQSGKICVCSVSSEDHRKLPTLVLSNDLASEEFAVYCMGDVVYVLDTCRGMVSATELNVTVRSEAYRIQRSCGDKSTKARRQRCLQSRGQTKCDAAEHWLRVFYHVFEKFSVRSLIEEDANPGGLFDIELGIIVNQPTGGQNTPSSGDILAVAKDYFHNVMVDLQRLNKPLFQLNLEKKVWCQNSSATDSLRPKPIRGVLATIISFLPVQICRAEDNMLKLLRDGDNATAQRIDSSKQNDSGKTEAYEIAQSLRFGLLSPFLESWGGRCTVVTSMGKQSTGKSYFLNHLTGTSFAISGSRCTDGAWMSLRILSPDMLLVVLDFEGLGSFERSEQEDIFLSVLNASVSLFTVFRMESRFDKDIDGLFSRFQKGVQLIKNDMRLFRGLLYMSVKDVNMNDQQGVVDELVAKLDGIFESNRDQNFLTEMYSGKLEINCSPPFGTVEYYQSMENDAAKTLREVVAPSEDMATGFTTGKAFLDCLRVVLAKISILDWTSMDKSTQNLLAVDVEQKLLGIIRTGYQVPRPLLAEAVIPSHLKEDVLIVSSREKLVIMWKEVCQKYPHFAAKWMTLNDLVALDSVEDETFDVGFDVTVLQNKKVGVIQKTLVVLFQQFLALQNKVYGNSRLTTEDYSVFDDFLAFVLCRRKMKASRWLHGFLGSRLTDVGTQLEQRYVDPLILWLSRCQHKCASCQLGCMHSVTHAMNVEHDCTTDHACCGNCEYAECRDESDSPGVPSCSRGAGHEGKCGCEKGEHTCGQPCSLARAPNCDHNCSQLAGHSGDHHCSVQLHICGVECSASTCMATCLLDIQRAHSVHKCAEVQCLHPCLMNGCKSNCGVRDHFHGQTIESCTFAKENGLPQAFGIDEDMLENNSMATVTHMCLGSHACAEMCSIDGICEQKVRLKKSSRTYKGARGSFVYVFHEMNGCKKQCAHVLPSGRQDHEGLEHSCAPQCSRKSNTEEEEQQQEIVHYCTVRCPSCAYYCNMEFGHMGLHATSHGNMRQTYFIAKSNDIDIEDRKYRVGECGTAEMCNLFCTKVGRGHVHYLPCDSKHSKTCTAAASKDHRRHCVDKVYPPPDKGMDELLHAQFWTVIGWEDPCTDEERALFAKCPFYCNAPEHEEEGKAPSYCILDAWHQPELKPEASNDGFAYIDGHKFECVHAVNSGKFHNIFVLDSSTSMRGQPWQDLLCACNEFVLNRHQDGGENDLVSYITFDDKSYIRCEAQPLGETLQMDKPHFNSGTHFAEGLRAANEVLSRNNFKEFKAVLIFFSDGRPCDIELAITIAQHIRSSYAKYDLKAFVVGFGYMDLAVLNRMAAEMGGEYRQVLEANALKTELQQIAAILCNSEASLALANPSTGPEYLERGQSKRASI